MNTSTRPAGISDEQDEEEKKNTWSGKHDVLIDAEVIYYTFLCHSILRDKPCDMTKRCDFKFVFIDVEKHIDSF